MTMKSYRIVALCARFIGNSASLPSAMTTLFSDVLGASFTVKVQLWPPLRLPSSIVAPQSAQLAFADVRQSRSLSKICLSSALKKSVTLLNQDPTHLKKLDCLQPIQEAIFPGISPPNPLSLRASLVQRGTHHKSSPTIKISSQPFGPQSAKADFATLRRIHSLPVSVLNKNGAGGFPEVAHEVRSNHITMIETPLHLPLATFQVQEGRKVGAAPFTKLFFKRRVIGVLESTRNVSPAALDF